MKQLKSDLAALDRKITSELATTHKVPDDRKGVNHNEKDGEEAKQSSTQQMVEVADTPAPSTATKESMVGEPADIYKPLGMVAANYGFTPSDGCRARPKL